MAKVPLSPHRQRPRDASSIRHELRAAQERDGENATRALSERARARRTRLGRAKYVERVHKKGKLTTRERIELLDRRRTRAPSRWAPSSTTADASAKLESPAAGVVTAFVRDRRPLDDGDRQRQHRGLGLLVAADAREDRARPGDGAAPAPAGRLPGRLLGPVPARAVALLPRAHRGAGHIFKKNAELSAGMACRRSPACSATASPAAATCRSSPIAST